MGAYLKYKEGDKDVDKIEGEGDSELGKAEKNQLPSTRLHNPPFNPGTVRKVKSFVILLSLNTFHVNPVPHLLN
jgi:hypothetical protein